MNEIIENFQFIRPEVLFTIIPIALFYIWRLAFSKQENLWQQIIPAHLYRTMTIQKGLVKSNKFIHFIFVGACIAVLSAAGPSWEKLPQAVYQTQSGKVILMDMSMSLRATDLSPNRLQRAKFKAIDLVNELNEGETGLIAYAGDAFVVSPLTDDASNLKTLIPALSPEIMPSQGSYALMGLEKAKLLLENAGYQSGEIYWLTDGIRIDEVREVRNFIKNSPYELSALLIGTESGAPILLSDGQMLKDNTGKIVVPSINENLFNQAFAGTSASYQLFSSDNSDIESIKRKIALSQQQDAELIEDKSGDTFKDMGPYLCILLLPIALYSFRKGVLLAFISLGFMSTLPYSQSAFALQEPQKNTVQTAPNAESTERESMINLAFKNADQRGKIAYDNNNYAKANELFVDPSWQAASAYKTKNYELAEKLYKQVYEQSGQLNDLYNTANAIAQQGRLEEALSLYEQVLEKDNNHQNAQQNKKIIEALLNQQQQNNDENQEQNTDDENKGQKQEQQQQSKDSSEQESDSNDAQQNDTQEKQEQAQDSQQQEQAQQDNNEQANEQDLKEQAEQQKGQQEKEQNEAEQSPEQQAQETQQNELSNEQREAISNQINMDDLTPEEQEELQRMQMLLNKVPDDPAYLLKRKMLLEAYKRKRSQPPTTQENW